MALDSSLPRRKRDGADRNEPGQPRECIVVLGEAHGGARTDLYAVDHHEHDGLGHCVEHRRAHDPEVVLEQLPQHIRLQDLRSSHGHAIQRFSDSATQRLDVRVGEQEGGLDKEATARKTEATRPNIRTLFRTPLQQLMLHWQLYAPTHPTHSLPTNQSVSRQASNHVDPLKLPTISALSSTQPSQ
eukprot:3712765-Rhodomonas_salina.2